jgi:prevent-host-death family protein
MVRFSTAEAHRHLAGLVNRAAVDYERIVLTRHGKAVAAIVSLEDAE